jgi:SAM-dependent methyltransferase
VVVVGAGADLVAELAIKAGAAGSVLAIEPEEGSFAALEARAGRAAVGAAPIRVARAELDDLQTDPAFVERALAAAPVQSAAALRTLQASIAAQRLEAPLVATGSADFVLLDGAVNRLPPERLDAALREAFRVLGRGKRLALTALLLDEPRDVAADGVKDGAHPVRSAPVETAMLAALGRAGFHGMNFRWRAEMPLRVLDKIELRAHVIEAHTGKQGPCMDRGQAVMYKGPWSEVHDDDGHRFVRGERVAVCDKTFNVMARAPYREHFLFLPPYIDLPLADAKPFDCHTPALRDPRVTKGLASVEDMKASGGSSDCC